MAEEPRRFVILVVEDEPLVRMIAVDVLVDHGMIVLEASCVEEALEIIQAEGRIDLLFTDINMPGDLDGLDLAAIAHRQQPDLKLIVTSGGVKLTDADVPDHGVFIPKPYDTRELAQLVEDRLSSAC